MPRVSIPREVPGAVVLFSNGVVMVFDTRGEQMPEYQGRYGDVVSRLRSLDLSNCQFAVGEWNRSLHPISQAEFFDPNICPLEVFGQPYLFGIGWTCHICRQWRPDALMSVVSTDLSLEQNLPPGTIGQNVRYCNDNPDCIEQAKSYRHLPKLQK